LAFLFIVLLLIQKKVLLLQLGLVHLLLAAQAGPSEARVILFLWIKQDTPPERHLSAEEQRARYEAAKKRYGIG
jgi:hypothetical protein